MTCGIYGITNKNTESMYVGQSNNIQRRFSQHCNIQPIDLAIANEGVDNFTLSIIEELPNDVNILRKRERYWINFYNAEDNPKHYNIRPGSHPNSLANLCSAKYTLWNTVNCHYDKQAMYRWGREPNPCRCFRFKYNTYSLPIGTFSEPVSCEIISQLTKDALK